MLSHLSRLFILVKRQNFKPVYQVCAIYDTETCNVQIDDYWRAYPILYIVNDLRCVQLDKYIYDVSDDVRYYRNGSEMLAYIDNLINWGRSKQIIPIIAAYNLMFDLQPIMYELSQAYDMEVNAQSSTNIYTLDLKDDGKTVLRFWDTFHLEMRGLSAMGAVCGLPKATGSWNYDLVRTPETDLTAQELYYAKRDVQVIPAYLKYLLDANDWLKPADLGVKVITKTSIVRQMARNRIYNLRYRKANGARMSIGKTFELLCKREMPTSFDIYALRKSCFRGGYTFTAAAFASCVVENVASLDVTSMHHAFINGRYIPTRFVKLDPDLLELECLSVFATSIRSVLKHYHKPFYHAFHIRCRIRNIRLRKDSAFDHWQIALLPMSKFTLHVADDFGSNEAARFAETHVKLSGWHDKACNAIFAFGKLYQADEVTLHLSELELWALYRVYEWDSFTVILGESTAKFERPPDYVTAQSNYLYELKNEMKDVCKRYTGAPMNCNDYHMLDAPIAKGLQYGEFTPDFMQSYYQSTVKGMSNGIYGVQAQDVFKPKFTVENGSVHVDDSTAVAAWNFDQVLKDNKSPVLYTYGMRIVGGSRLHLVIAIELLYKHFRSRIDVLAGDTDSLKIRCDDDVCNDELLKALEPLHSAVTKAITFTMQRLHDTQPTIASSLDNVGCFDIENCGNSDRYAYHMEAWNKARVSIDTDGEPHVTCAGLSRPAGSYTIETFIKDMMTKDVCGPYNVLPAVMGYNVLVPFNICHSLEHSKPEPQEKLDLYITDYKGKTSRVNTYQSIALYPASRMLGDTEKRANRCNLEMLQDVDDTPRELHARSDDADAYISYVGGDLYL